MREFSQMIGWLASTANAVLSAPLQYPAMQRQQIVDFSMEKDYYSEINL